MIVIRDTEELNEFIELIAENVFSKLKFFAGSQSEESTLLSPAEAANLMGVSKPTLDKLAASGVINKHQLPDSRRVYFFKNEILEVIKRHKQNNK